MSAQPEPQFIYKVASREAFDDARASGTFAGMPVDHADGFIHFSTADQLAETLAKHFAGQSELMLFAVPAAPLGEVLRWEVSRGGALFPHLYASLPMPQIAWAEPISVADDGSCQLPDRVR